MLTTSYTELLGCRVPLQQAGMGGVTTADLAAAVADAGGVGMLAMPMASAAEVADALTALGRRTTGVFGFNVLMPFLDRGVLAVAAQHCRLVELFYGDPDAALVELVHAGDALACWQVGSLDEAVAAVDAGCDLVVAQGVEAGGHVRGKVGLLPLLSQVVDAVAVPVVAAGGIATARAVAACLAAGAAAVKVGTRFVATHEADAHPDYVAALLAARAEDTVLTEAFSVLWPDAPHRVLRSCVERAAAHEGEVVGRLPVGDRLLDLPRHGVMTPGRSTTGAIEAMALYAGQSVGDVRQVQSAGEVVRELAAGAEELLRAW
jgi:NAD(P)H-dependent flavin oxidoreductase YrpB (nitropropane dioxygenase family)